LAVIVAGVLVRFFFAGLYRVDTASMEPTIHGKPPEHVLVLYWGVGAPARFDLVVLLREGHSEAEVKRVAGLPREKVALLEGDLMIDDQRLGREEPRFRSTSNRGRPSRRGSKSPRSPSSRTKTVGSWTRARWVRTRSRGSPTAMRSTTITST
jgi:signal peptidase I